MDAMPPPPSPSEAKYRFRMPGPRRTTAVAVTQRQLQRDPDFPIRRHCKHRILTFTFQLYTVARVQNYCTYLFMT